MAKTNTTEEVNTKAVKSPKYTLKLNISDLDKTYSAESVLACLESIELTKVTGKCIFLFSKEKKEYEVLMFPARARHIIQNKTARYIFSLKIEKALQ